MLLGIALAGALGAAFSGLLNAIHVVATEESARVHSTTGDVVLTRLFVGALGAVGLYILLSSGLLALPISSRILMALSFAAGFSERLVLRNLERVAGDGGEGRRDPQ